MEISEAGFVATVTKWSDDVKRESLVLFRAGIPHDHCLPIALKIVEAKDVGLARQFTKFGPRM